MNCNKRNSPFKIVIQYLENLVNFGVDKWNSFNTKHMYGIFSPLRLSAMFLHFADNSDAIMILGIVVGHR